MNQSGISGQETMVLFRNAIDENRHAIKAKFRPALTSKCRTTPSLYLLFETQKQLFTMA